MAVAWRLQWYLHRSGILGAPAYLNLEPTNRCNLSCRWCVASSARPGGLLELSLAESILAQAADAGVGEIRFFLAGEPLLHPSIGDLVAAASARGLRTVLHTNAMLLDGDRARSLIEAGLDDVSFSINGVDNERIRQVQRGADLDTMVENVRGFHEMRRRLGGRGPRTTLQIIQPPDEAVISDSRVAALLGSPGPDRILRLAPHGWGGQLRSEEVVLRGRRYHPCQPLWQGMSVGWDGRVFLCCADLNGAHPVGDLVRQSLTDVWHGDRLMEVRQRVASNRREGLPLCASCDAVWWKYHPIVHDIRRALWRVAGRRLWVDSTG
ncbi:radical SAM protein [Candidatus Fermentibacteria bacterium]|nr:radical SAM protein [Candidatus Fermentibacteria bacterium]